MTTLGVTLFILLLLALLWRELSRDYIRGLAFAVCLWVGMTTMLRIELPGSLPELTIHRLILISVFCFWYKRRNMRQATIDPIVRKCFFVWAVANAISLLGTSVDFIFSFKRFLDFVGETWLYYVIVSSSLRSGHDALKIIRAALLALSIVAGLAVIEHYNGFNPVDRFIPGYSRGDQGARDVMATYQHRILLGTAMAMGVPLAFYLSWQRIEPFRRRFLLLASSCLLMAACFFSMSRGPWMALGSALFVLALGGSKKARFNMLWGALLVALTLIMKPGVKDTLIGKYEATIDTDSHKGGTFQYRIELWKIAYSKISESPWRFLFGYGPGAGSGLDIDWELSYREDRHRQRTIQSWDNHFAYSLFQSGIVGFSATMLLLSRVLYFIFLAWRNARPDGKDPLLCLFASAFALFFMMSNVLIFAKQLDYLFWSIAAAAPLLGRFYARSAHSHSFQPVDATAGQPARPAGSLVPNSVLQ